MEENYHIEINISEQRLRLFHDGRIVKDYSISTAKNGPGEQMDSECTPRGDHIIAEKIGENCSLNAVFVNRQPTGEIFSSELRQQYPGRDWILSRILWLRGLEQGTNLGGNVDSYDRFIYIHGSPDDVRMGSPGSRGCIRMQNADVIDLFDRVSVNTKVTIREN